MKEATNTPKQDDILETALQAVCRVTGLCLNAEYQKITIQADVDANLHIAEGCTPLFALVKKWAQQANLGALIQQIKHLPGPGILVADYVNPKMAEKLRQENAQFIDTAGNAYINMPPVYVYVAGQRRKTPQAIFEKGEIKRAFEPTGLKVIFAFLCQPDLVNAPYRDIAEKTGVALGTVGWVIKGLQQAGFLRDKNKPAGRQLQHYEKLLTRWVETYPEKLRPKQLLGEFYTEETGWWKRIDMRQYHGYWGGEIAAAAYTDYLRPQVASVYLHEQYMAEFMAEARLRKATGYGENPANVIIYKTYWPENHAMAGVAGHKELVHPILVYADLLATGDTRNLETARMLYEKYITQYFSED